MDVSAELFTQVDQMFIECELPQREVAEFKRKYYNLGGSLKGGGLLVQRNRGANCRIYFNASQNVVDQLAMLGYQAICGDRESKRGPRYNPQFKWRIDSNALFWKLIRNGFSLGGWPALIKPEDYKS